MPTEKVINKSKVAKKYSCTTKTRLPIKVATKTKLSTEIGCQQKQDSQQTGLTIKKLGCQ